MIALTPLEILALRGLVEKREIIEAEFQQAFAEIAERHGLPPGAIGTTHIVNLPIGAIMEKDDAPPDAEAAPVVITDGKPERVPSRHARSSRAH
jgi:hypothetical protein